MQRHHTGSGRRRVIPADWDAAHRPVVHSTLTGTAVLSAPAGAEAWDDATEQMVAVSTDPYFEGPCRVQSLGARGDAVIAAQDDELAADYLVVLDSEAGPITGHHVTVSDTGDPLLDGAVLRVERVVLGTLRFERDLFCRLTT